MKRRLYKIAFLTSPILAMYGVAPVYFFNRVPFAFFIAVASATSLAIFIFWNINILILTKVKNLNGWKRYSISYFIVLSTDLVFTTIGTGFLIRPGSINEVYPFIAMFAINTIILFMSNFIILQYQKETADKEIEQLKLSNLEAQKQMLLQQLQPHFLFNTLSTLKSLIGESPSKAEAYTVRLSEFLRYSVSAQDHEAVSLAEELKFTQDYIELQKARFGEAIQCRIDIPAEYLSKKIPVYALQTLVENAIKHNAFNDKKKLSIQIEVMNNRIKVENNRFVKRLQIPSGTGLRNLSERYHLMGNTALEITHTESTFTVLLNLL